MILFRCIIDNVITRKDYNDKAKYQRSTHRSLSLGFDSQMVERVHTGNIYMSYKLTAVYGVFNAGVVSNEFIFDTYDELQDFYQETISKMSEEEAEHFDYHSKIEELQDEKDV